MSTRRRPGQPPLEHPTTTVGHTARWQEVLDAYHRALGREAHVLAVRPDLTWQQLHNRLQWEGGAVEQLLGSQREPRVSAGARPWFRTGTRPQESEALIAVLAGHEGAVHACAYSPDARVVVSAGQDGTLRLWDAEAGNELLILEGDAGAVVACAFSPDGNRIVSASVDGTLEVWDSGDASRLRTLMGHEGRVNACAFSPDGGRIVSGGSDTTVRVWDAETTAEPLILEGHTAGVLGCSFGPDGRRIASTGEDGTLRVWDARTGAELRSRAVVHFGDERSGRGCAFTPDGARVACIANITFRERKRHGKEEELGWTLTLWDFETGDGDDFPGGHGAHVNACAFGPDGRRIVTAGADHTVQVWDRPSREGLQTLEGHTGPVLACAFGPDGGRIASAGVDGTVRLWDAEGGVPGEAPDRAGRWEAGQPGGLEKLRDWGAYLPDHTDAVWGCGVSPDGTRIVTVSATALKLWDPAAGAAVRTVRPRIGYFDQAPAWAFSPDGARLVSPDERDALTVWDAESGAEILSLDTDADAVWGIAFGPDSARIVAAGEGGILEVWDARTGASLQVLDHGSTLIDWEVGPDGRRIVSSGRLPGATESLMESILGTPASERAPLRVWDIETGAFLHTLEPPAGGVEACGFSPDARRIVSAGDDGDLKLWDAERGTCLRTFQGAHTGVPRARSWAFTPDGRRIVTPGEGETLELWDAVDGAHVRTFEGRSGLVKAAVFSPDGRRILTAGWDRARWVWDGTLRVWDASAGALANTLEGRAGRLMSFAFSPDGRWVVSAAGGDLGGILHLWETATGEAVATLPLPHSMSTVDVHPRGWMVCGSDDGTIHWAELKGARIERFAEAG